MSGARVIRLVFLSVITIALAAVAGWFVFGPKSAQLLLTAKASYQAGLQALQDKNGSSAQLRFQETQISARNTLQRVEEEARSNKRARPEQLQEWTAIAGNAMYLEAAALRDEAFAKSLAAGKEIPETLDAATGTKYRSFSNIADAKVKDEAIGWMRKAAMRLPKDPEVQAEAIRLELAQPTIAWSLVRGFAQEMLKLKPDDTRSLYVLARYDFEQPEIRIGQVSGPPKAPEKRSRNIVNDALAHLTKLKAIKDYPLGRTLFLEAQIRQWLANESQNRGETAKAQKERDALESLLFDEKTGALARFKQGEGMKNVGPWDADGIVGLHLLALDLAVEQQRKKGESLAKVKATLADTVAIAQELEKPGLGVYTLENLNVSLVQALAKAQSVLATEAGKPWLDTVELTKKSLKRSFEKDAVSSAAVAEFSVFLQREAAVASKQGDQLRADQLRKESREWVEDALANFAKQKSPAPGLELHILAADMKFSADGKRDLIEPHLKALRDSKNPNVKGFAHLIQGAVYEREGRLDKARQELEEVLTLNNADLKLRANMALTNIYLGLGQADKALDSLQALEKVYEGYEELTPQEKVWAQNFLRGPDDLAVLQITANLETAKQRITKFSRDQPGKGVPASLYAIHEKIAFETLAKLPKQKKHALLARQALINYYAFSGRLDRAEKELALASADFPDSVALLQLDVSLNVRRAAEKLATKSEKEVEKELKETVDKRIQKFISQFPADSGARLYWVSWLARTGRTDEALDYLKSPTNFPGVKDTTYHRLMATILVSKGDAKEASRIMQQMPQDPLIDAMLIQIADSSEAKSKSVQAAMSRYVSNGLFRIWNAELAFQEKRHADAANHFFNTLDFTQVKSLAQIGLQRSLLALAGEKPAEARKLITEMLKDYPNLPMLLLPYAVACLNLDDVGTVDDNWDTTKTMASALHAWDAAVQASNPDRAATMLTKAELWTRSNYPEAARAEVLRTLQYIPADPSALTLIIRLDVNLSLLQDARKYLQQLKKIQPAAASTILLEAQVESADGRNAQAVELLETMLEKHPKESAAYGFLVGVLAHDKQSAKALKWSQTWVEKLPDDLDGAQNLVAQLTLWKKGDAKQKASEFIAHALKDVRKRLDERKYADEKDPEKKRTELFNEARLLLELRFAQAFLRGEDLAEAEQRLHAIIKERPNAADAYVVLGDIQVRQQKWQASETTYTKILELEKDNFVAGNNLAWILAMQLNQPEKALELLRSISKGRFSNRSLPGDRLHPEVLDTLGVVYLKLNRPEHYMEMAQIFEAARKRYPRDPRMYLYSGYAFAGLADNTKAAQMFQSAIALAMAKDSSISEAQRESVIRDAEAASKKLIKK